MGSPGKTAVSRKPPRAFEAPVLVAKAFVSAASNAAAWRGFFEKRLFGVFLSSGRSCVFELQVACLETERAVWRGWVVLNTLSRGETSEALKT